MIVLDSVDDPRLDPFRDLKSRDERWANTFVAEGEKLVERLLRSRFPTEAIVCTPAVADRLGPLIADETSVFLLESSQISSLIGYQFHRGVLGLGRVVHSTTLEMLCSGLRDREYSRIVVCPELRDPTNLGAIIRSATGMGADFVVTGRSGVQPFSRRVLRTSMGSVLQIPIVQTDDWDTVFATLHSFGIQSVATVLSETARPLREFAFPRHSAIWLGNEDAGLPDALLARCEHHVTMPMSADVDSLNVAVAAGIVLYCATAQP